MRSKSITYYSDGKRGWDEEYYQQLQINGTSFCVSVEEELQYFIEEYSLKCCKEEKDIKHAEQQTITYTKHYYEIPNMEKAMEIASYVSSLYNESLYMEDMVDPKFKWEKLYNTINNSISLYNLKTYANELEKFVRELSIIAN